MPKTQPVNRFNVLRKDMTQPAKVKWRKVGDAVQWPDGSLTLNLYMFPQTFHVLPADREEQKS